MAEIIISGIANLEENLGTLEAFAYLRKPIQKWLYRFQDRLATYPQTIPSGLFMRTATEKQKRFYFWALNNGKIPSGRTGDTGRAWTTELNMTTEGIEGKVGNNRNHAVFVQGEFQQPFHSGRWLTVNEVKDLFEKRFNSDIESVITSVIRNMK